jgi:hypothetical protein
MNDLLIIGVSTGMNHTQRFQFLCKRYCLEYQLIDDVSEILDIITNTNAKIIIVGNTSMIPLAFASDIYRKFYEMSHNVIASRMNRIDDLCNDGLIIGYRDNMYRIFKERDFPDMTIENDFFLTHFDPNILIEHGYIYNHLLQTYPVIAHNNLDDYARDCIENLINEYHPLIFIALYVNSVDMACLKRFLTNVANIDYPNRIVSIYDKGDNDVVSSYAKTIGWKYYPSVSEYTYADFLSTNAEYYFLLEQKCTITNRNILSHLLSYFNDYRHVIAPLLISKENQIYSNYWGDIQHNGYYKRSGNYLDVVRKTTRGIFNAKYVASAILLDRYVLMLNFVQENHFSDPDMKLCYNFRQQNILMYVVNVEEYGYLH